MATQLDCSIDRLPLKYLGIRISGKKPSKADWEILIEKIEKKLPIWQGKLLSMGGRLVLLDAVLSSIPLYYLAIFQALKWCIDKIDKIRKQFLWAGPDLGKKNSILSNGIQCVGIRNLGDGGMKILYL